MTNPYSPSKVEPHSTLRARGPESAASAFLMGCRNGLFWSLFVMVPMSLFIVPGLPRRIVVDSDGNIVPYLERVGYAGMLGEAFWVVAPVSLVWTVAAGMVDYSRFKRRATEMPESGSRQTEDFQSSDSRLS